MHRNWLDSRWTRIGRQNIFMSKHSEKKMDETHKVKRNQKNKKNNGNKTKKNSYIIIDSDQYHVDFFNSLHWICAPQFKIYFLYVWLFQSNKWKRNEAKQNKTKQKRKRHGIQTNVNIRNILLHSQLWWHTFFFCSLIVFD